MPLSPLDFFRAASIFSRREGRVGGRTGQFPGGGTPSVLANSGLEGCRPLSIAKGSHAPPPKGVQNTHDSPFYRGCLVGGLGPEKGPPKRPSEGRAREPSCEPFGPWCDLTHRSLPIGASTRVTVCFRHRQRRRILTPWRRLVHPRGAVGDFGGDVRGGPRCCPPRGLLGARSGRPMLGGHGGAEAT